MRGRGLSAAGTRHVGNRQESPSEPQYQSQPFIHRAHHIARQGTHALGEHLAIERNELRDIHDRGLAETTIPFGNADIAGGISKGEAGCHSRNHHSGNTALIERIRLNDNHWPPIPRPGACRRRHRRPPEFTTLHRQAMRLVRLRMPDPSAPAANEQHSAARLRLRHRVRSGTRKAPPHRACSV
jgi:hypothetical protein